MFKLNKLECGMKLKIEPRNVFSHQNNTSKSVFFLEILHTQSIFSWEH